MANGRRLIALDATAAVLTVATFAQAGEPDLLFHAVWVVLVFQAFLYGLRVSAPRILVASLAVIAYSLLDGSGGFTPAELSGVLFTEWPLMFVIIAIVAIMADRVTRTGRDVAGLERRTHEQLLTARADERRRLSSELHDGLGQTLTALVLTLDAAESSLASEATGPGAKSREALRRAQEIAGVALEETREVARQLRPARMRELGLATAIRELAANAGRPVDFDFDPQLATPMVLPVEVEMEAYRIVQEAVGNAVRHASAQTIRIGMHLVRGGRVQIEVVDDGTGFNMHPAAGAGLGLVTMSERAAAIGGTLSLESTPGYGTRVRLRLPLQPAGSTYGATADPGSPGSARLADGTTPRMQPVRAAPIGLEGGHPR